MQDALCALLVVAIHINLHQYQLLHLNTEYIHMLRLDGSVSNMNNSLDEINLHLDFFFVLLVVL